MPFDPDATVRKHLHAPIAADLAALHLSPDEATQALAVLYAAERDLLLSWERRRDDRVWLITIHGTEAAPTVTIPLSQWIDAVALHTSVAGRSVSRANGQEAFPCHSAISS